MSRVAQNPINIPAGVRVSCTEAQVTIEGVKGTLTCSIKQDKTQVLVDENQIRVKPINKSREADAQSGTVRALLYNTVMGVATGFEKKLKLVGVGYKAELFIEPDIQRKSLKLSLGYSHPIIYKIPEGVTVELNAPTEVTIRGCDKQLVGQVAAEIRNFRLPEPYKGKGVLYSYEKIKLKETKKK